MSRSNRAINVQPKVVDLLLYAGDGITFRLLCKNSEGAPVDITGSVSAQIRVEREDAAAVVSFTTVMTDAYLGIVRLSLTGDQTQELVDHESAVNGKFVGVWDIEWDPSDAEPRTLSQGSVECVVDVTR